MWEYAGIVSNSGGDSGQLTALLAAGGLPAGSSGQRSDSSLSLEGSFGQLVSNYPLADRYENETWHCVVLGYGEPGCAQTALNQLIAGNFSSAAVNSESFLIIALNSNGREAYLVTDLFGSLPCSYSAADALHFAARPATLAALLGHSEIDPQALYNYVFFHVIPSPESIYRGIRKIPNASVLHWNGAVTVNRYYRPTFSEQPAGANERRALVNCLEKEVCGSANTTGKVGAFLSGGLDSSSVVGMLARCADDQTDGPAEAFTIGFEADGYDEIPFARATAKHFGVKLHEHYLSQQEVLDNIPLLASRFGEPFANSSAIPAFVCAKFAADHGVTRLLAGDGGDELFAGNERYAQQKVFHPYELLPKPAQQLLKQLVNAVPGKLTPGPLSKPRNYVNRAAQPLPDRLQAFNFLSTHDLNSVFSGALTAQISSEQPYALLRDEYHRPSDASSLNRMLYTDWKFILADNDLIKVGTMCRAAGVEVRYPMLGDSLVDLSCRISSRDKLPGNKLRHFYKQSCRGFLAQSTLNKSKKGFGLPFGVWLRDHQGLREIAGDSLHSLKARGIFNNQFIDETQRLHRDSHAAYYGELVWLMMTLEQWLQHHAPNWSMR